MAVPAAHPSSARIGVCGAGFIMGSANRLAIVLLDLMLLSAGRQWIQPQPVTCEGTQRSPGFSSIT
jgi:hypothetical protein